MTQPSPPNPRVHFSMLRNYQLADLITLANGAAGTASVFATMSYLTTPEPWRIYLALSLLPLALILDIADGKVARRHNEPSPFGQELDSLADIVSFGVAPGGSRLRSRHARHPRRDRSYLFCCLRHQPFGAL